MIVRIPLCVLNKYFTTDLGDWLQLLLLEFQEGLV